MRRFSCPAGANRRSRMPPNPAISTPDWGSVASVAISSARTSIESSASARRVHTGRLRYRMSKISGARTDFPIPVLPRFYPAEKLISGAVYNYLKKLRYYVASATNPDLTESAADPHMISGE